MTKFLIILIFILFLVFEIILWMQIDKFLIHLPENFSLTEADIIQKDNFVYKEYKSSNNPNTLVVYLHGSFTNINKFHRLTHEFSHIILEYPGYFDNHKVSMYKMMEYSKKFLLQLVYDRKPDRLIVVGQDIGAYFATKAKESNPWIHKVVLVSPYKDLKSLISDNTHWTIGSLIPELYQIKTADLIYYAKNDSLVSKDQFLKIKGELVELENQPSRDISIEKIFHDAKFLELVTGKILTKQTADKLSTSTVSK